MARSALWSTSSGCMEPPRGQGDADARRDQHVAPVHDERPLDLGGDPLRHAVAPAEIEASSSSSANSSPPRRATVSSGRRHAARRWPTSTRRRSPTSWPSVSFRILKRSRSRKRTARLVPAPLGPREGVREAIHEERAVGQPGQGIAEGLAGELVEAAGELVDLLRLLLDRREHAREGAHEGADLVLAAGLDGQVRVLLVAELRGARQRGGDVPDDEGAARHQDRGEDQEGRDADRVGQAHDRAPATRAPER